MCGDVRVLHDVLLNAEFVELELFGVEGRVSLPVEQLG